MQTLLIVVQLVPAIIAMIKAIEEALPATGYGADKLAAVREIMENTYAGIKEIWPIIEKVIGILVGLFNKAGVFEAPKE